MGHLGRFGSESIRKRNEWHLLKVGARFSVICGLLSIGSVFAAETQDPKNRGGSSPVEYPKIRSVQQKSTHLKWMTLDDIVVSDSMKDMARPSIAGAPNGDLYVAAEDLDDNSIVVYRSIDIGASWSAFKSMTFGSDSRHPSITYAESVDGEKWLYLAFEKVNADDSREIWVVSFNCVPGGSNRSSKIVGPVTMGSSSEHIQPRITTDNVQWPDSYFLYVTYTAQEGGKYPIYFSRSLDRGVAWSPPVDVSGGSLSTTWLPRPDIAYGEAGLFVAFVKPGWTGSTIANQVWVSKSGDSGFTWLSPDQLTTAEENQYHPAVAAAHDTNSVLVVYSKESSTDSDLYSAWSTDGGGTWSKDNTVVFSVLDSEDYADVAVSHDLDVPGWFHVAFIKTVGATNSAWYARFPTSDPGAGTGQYRVNDSGAIATFYPRPTIAVDPTKSGEAEACIAWTDIRGLLNEVYFAREWHIFSDGFEPGNTFAWSTSVGGP